MPSTHQQDWTLSAKCAGMDDVFFVDDPEQRIIARFCNDCPVRQACLDEAMKNRIAFGVWGGTTERQRRKMFRQEDARRDLAGRRDLIAV